MPFKRRSMYAKVRRMFFREKLSISEIQRRTSLSRNTVRKWLKAERLHPYAMLSLSVRYSPSI